jgi:hypothetical protein
MPARLLCGLLLVTLAVPARGGEQLSPPSEALLLLRILAYDRQLTKRAADAVTVVLLTRPDDVAGQARREALGLALDQAALQFTVAGLPVRWVALWSTAPDLPARLRQVRASAVLLVGAASGEPAAPCRSTRAAKVLSLAESRAAVDACVSVGLVLRGSKAGVLVNLVAARAEEADLEPALLVVAEVLVSALPGPQLQLLTQVP